jgi:hypothetical protein
MREVVDLEVEIEDKVVADKAVAEAVTSTGVVVAEASTNK